MRSWPVLDERCSGWATPCGRERWDSVTDSHEEGFTELTLDPAEGHGKTRVGGDRDGAFGCLPGLRRGGADQVGPRLRPAALAVQGLRPAIVAASIYVWTR